MESLNPVATAVGSAHRDVGVGAVLGEVVDEVVRIFGPCLRIGAA